MKKDNQRIKNIKNKIENIVNSFDWETFENDRLTCLAKWQYYESIDLTNEDRYELDKEAYIRTFFNNIYNTTHEFDETTCIVFLLNQMKDVKHPIFLQYLKYLEKLLITIEPKIVLNEPDNPFPEIFVNGYAYQMFLDLKQLLVNKNPLSQYGYIYYGLKDPKLKAINDIMTEPKFICFVNKKFNAGINAKKFNFRNQQKYEKTFTTILNKYKPLILGEPKKAQY